MSDFPLCKRYAKRACALCGSTDSKLLFRQTFSELSSGSLLQGYDVVICGNCGFAFADGIPPQQVFDAYYKEMSKYELPDIGGGDQNYDVARFETVASFLSPYLSSPQRRILEIGCSTGRLLSILKGRGFQNLSGLDPSPACAHVAGRMYGIRVETSTLSEMRINDQSVEFIIALGVLEHVRDLDAALDHLSRILVPRGRFYVGVPDASRYARAIAFELVQVGIGHNMYTSTNVFSSCLRYSSLEKEKDQVSPRILKRVKLAGRLACHAAWRQTGCGRPNWLKCNCPNGMPRGKMRHSKNSA